MAIFISEAIMKIIALGFEKYFENSWYKLDLFIIAAAILG